MLPKLVLALSLALCVFLWSGPSAYAGGGIGDQNTLIYNPNDGDVVGEIRNGTFLDVSTPPISKYHDLATRALPFAILSQAVYSVKPTVEVSGQTWFFLEDRRLLSGFHAAVYMNNKETPSVEDDEYVLVFEGTTPRSAVFKETPSLRDLFSDLLNLTTASPQHNQAIDYTDEMISKYGSKNMTITGHSLGGNLAQVVGAMKGLPTYTFNTTAVGTLLQEAISPVMDTENITNIVLEADWLSRKTDTKGLFSSTLGKTILVRTPVPVVSPHSIETVIEVLKNPSGVPQ